MPAQLGRWPIAQDRLWFGDEEVKSQSSRDWAIIILLDKLSRPACHLRKYLSRLSICDSFPRSRIMSTMRYSIAQVAFGIYTAHANVFQIYGTLSAIFALMLWVYYVCVIFLYGAYVSAQWEVHFTKPAPPTLGSPSEAR